MEPDSCRRVKCLNPLRVCMLHCVPIGQSICCSFRNEAPHKMHGWPISQFICQTTGFQSSPSEEELPGPWPLVVKPNTVMSTYSSSFQRKNWLCGYNYNIKLSNGRAHSLSAEPMGSLPRPYYDTLLFSEKTRGCMQAVCWKLSLVIVNPQLYKATVRFNLLIWMYCAVEYS